MIDTHIHVGQFNELYISPSEIHNLMGNLGIDYYAVASTTQCEENYIKVLSEFHELINLDNEKVIPIMWITPNSLQGNIAWYLESDINWKIIKIHPFFNQTEWLPDSSQLAEVIDIAHYLNLPLLIHTGEDNCCRADLYESTIKDYPNVTFILAHGRPINTSIELAKKYQNAYVDTAFMPLDHINSLVRHGLSEKILWGSDMCIPQFFNPEIDLISYYKNRLSDVMNFCSLEQFEQMTFKNAQRILNIKST